MNKIVECKLSLLEKDKNFSVDKKGQGNYIIRATAIFHPEEYLNKVESYLNEEEYEEFILTAFKEMYNSLRDECRDKVIDSVGLWIAYEDKTLIDNAMDLSVLEAMEQYGQENIIPIVELTKMTLKIHES